MRAAIAALIVAILLTAFPLTAVADDEGDDQDEAQEAVDRGDVVPLAEVLARPDVRKAGDPVRVRLLHDGGRWTYQLRCVDASGQLNELNVDASRPHAGGRPESH
jgi:uncharacterized membrane protein YkoI